MAVSTHRWRPNSNIKSGYSLRKKVKNSKNQQGCLINMKFENSSYYVGVSCPISDVYLLSESDKNNESLLKELSKTSRNNELELSALSKNVKHNELEVSALSKSVRNNELEVLALPRSVKNIELESSKLPKTAINDDLTLSKTTRINELEGSELPKTTKINELESSALPRTTKINELEGSALSKTIKNDESIGAYKSVNNEESIAADSKHSITAFSESIQQTVLKKLYATEYVDAKSVIELPKLKDPLVRSFIVTEEPAFVEDALSIVELLKIGLISELWESFKIIVVSKNYDVKQDILRLEKHMQNSTAKQFTLKQNKKDNENDDDEEEDDRSYEEEDNDIDNDSTNTTFDEDAETRMICTMATSKFRDSRIIINNKKKMMTQPEIDPIERCFTALMKMMEDNIFSASKGLTEVNCQIEQMLIESDIDYEHLHSQDSDDIRVVLM